MKLTISGKNMVVSDALRGRIEKRISRLTRYFWDDVDVQVRLSQEKSSRNVAEITVFIGSTILRAEETSTDMYASIDKAIDKIVSQLRKHHTKFTDRLREAEILAAEQAEMAELTQPAEGHALVREKRFAVKPMSVEDAIAQMEMLEHDFFIFIDDQTHATGVVYRRRDGNYGLLIPENA